MRGISARAILLPVLLAGGVGACANNGVRPGYVNTASGYSTASASTYGQPVGSGRVVAINDVSLQGGGGGSSGGGMSNGTMMGGLLGGLGGIAIGASGGRGLGGGLIGGVLGAVAGGIAGTIIDRHTSIGGGGRGIEVTVQKDDGQQVTVAQRDDGDVQLGDRVQILQDRNGVAKAVRDNSRQQDYQNQNGYQNAGPAPQDYRQAPPPRDYRQANNYGGGNGSYGGGGYSGGSYGGGYSQQPQDYRQGQSSQGYGPQPADYGQQPNYAPPQSSSHSGYSSYSGGGYSGGGYQNSGYANQYQTGPQPQNDPRYGTLQ